MFFCIFNAESVVVIQKGGNLTIQKKVEVAFFKNGVARIYANYGETVVANSVLVERMFTIDCGINTKAVWIV